jgi:LysM repeat protein
MKPHRPILVFTLVFSSVAFAAQEQIELSGVMTANGKTRVALTDTSRKTTTWVETGQEFGGYMVSRYDAKEEAVFLSRNGREIRVPLTTAKSTDSKAGSTVSTAAASQALNDATGTAIRSNLRLLASAARQYQAEHGVTTVGYLQLVGPDKLIKELKPVAGENYSTLNFGPGVTAVSVTTANGTTVSYDVPAISPAVANAAGASGPAAANPSTAAPASAAPVPTPPATTTATPTGRQPASPAYTIQGGDTWEKISGATGVPVPQLKQLNPAFLEGAPLPAGQTIRLR